MAISKKEISKISDISIEYKPRKHTSYGFSCSRDIAEYSFRNWPELALRERMFCYYLDNKNNVVGRYEVAVGTISQCLVEPRNIFQAAILCNAARFVMVHNHPSGDDTIPSASDRALTERIKKAGDILGITLLDHLVISKNKSYSSFADLCLI